MKTVLKDRVCETVEFCAVMAAIPEKLPRA
jgi:hypothetical protein